MLLVVLVVLHLVHQSRPQRVLLGQLSKAGHGSSSLFAFTHQRLDLGQRLLLLWMLVLHCFTLQLLLGRRRKEGSPRLPPLLVRLLAEPPGRAGRVALAARLAHVLLLLGVDVVDVLFQVAQVCAPELAVRAGVGLLARVKLLVALEVVPVGEAAGTDGALVTELVLGHVGRAVLL